MYEFQDFHNMEYEDKPVTVGWPEEKIAAMLHDLYGDRCPRTYHNFVCDPSNGCHTLDCWKQFLKHYKLRGRSQ